MADQHVIDIADNGSWTIQHTKACPLDERSCPVFKAAEQIVTETDVKPGRFVVELGPLDQLLIGREVDEHGQVVIEEPAAERTAARRRAVHIDLNPFPTPSSVVIDEVDLADAVSAVKVYADVRSIPEVVLTMPVLALSVKGRDCDVRLDEATHDALIELGWVPPSPETAAAKDARLNFYAQRHIAKLGLSLASRLLAQLDTYWPSDGELERWRELLDVLVADNFALDPEHDSTAPGGVTDLHGTGRGIHGHWVLSDPLCDPCALLLGELQRAGLVQDRPSGRCTEQAAHGGSCDEPIKDGHCPNHGRVELTRPRVWKLGVPGLPDRHVTRLRDRHGCTWLRANEIDWSLLDGNDITKTFPYLLQHHGPLTEVIENPGAGIPDSISTSSDGVASGQPESSDAP
jgi:hypothetical protein